MNPDGVGYLDMADAYIGGDFAAALNASWSPLYSWFLSAGLIAVRPLAYWEFTMVHVVNFLIYLGALACFEFFLVGLLRPVRGEPTGAAADLREWAIWGIGYALFLVTALRWVTLSSVTPDLAVAGLVYLASGILVRIRSARGDWRLLAALGLVAGLGYLAKTAMFPLAFVFIAAASGGGGARVAVGRALVALLTFTAVAAPFVAALSAAKQRFTIGDSGRLNYAWHVNRVPLAGIWEGDGFGVPAHSARKLLDSPAVYEFGTPVVGTYPLRYDPSYWYEGVKPRIDWGQQLRALAHHALQLAQQFQRWFAPLAVAWLALFLASARRRDVLRTVARGWWLGLPAATGIGIYMLVVMETRYVAAFVVVLGLGFFSALRGAWAAAGRFSGAVVSAALLVMGASFAAVDVAPAAYAVAADLRSELRGFSTHVHWQVAEGLRELGIRSGDRVGIIGAATHSAWARLARVRITAELPVGEAPRFWAAGPEGRQRVLDAFARAGVQAVVADQFPSGDLNGWQPIRGTGHYVYLLGSRVTALSQEIDP